MKTKIILVGLIISFLTLNINAQSFQWAGNLGSNATDYGQSIATDNNGNVISVGLFQNTIDLNPGTGTANYTAAGSFDGYVCKLDADGNYLWGFSIGQTGADGVNGVGVDGFGNVYITGLFTGTVDFDPSANTYNLSTFSTYSVDAFWAKYDSNGNFLNAYSWGGAGYDQGNDIEISSSGDIYIIGDFEQTVDFDPGAPIVSKTSNGGHDIFISRFNTSHQISYLVTIGSSNSSIFTDHGSGLDIDASGNIFICGFYGGTMNMNPNGTAINISSSGGSADGFVAKYNTSSILSWTKSLGAGLTDKAHDCTVDNNGNIYVTGEFTNTVNFNPGGASQYITSVPSSHSDAFVSKYNTSGNNQWVFKLGGIDIYDVGNSIANNGSAIFVGGFYKGTNVDFNPAGGNPITSTGGYNGFAAAYDLSGNHLWSGGLNPVNNSRVNGIDANASNEAVITGQFYGATDFDTENGTFELTPVGTYDAFVAKYSLCGIMSSSSSVNISATCRYTVPSGDETYTSSGIYEDTIPNSAGCDSIITINLTVNPVADQTVSQTGSDIVCSGSTTIGTSSSEVDISYYLRNDFDNSIVDGPLAGTGSGLTFNTGNIDQSTTYNIIANKNGYALDFDGVDDYAVLINPTGMPTGSAVTLEAWIYPTSFLQDEYSGVVSYGPRTCQTSALLALSSEGRPSFANWCNDFIAKSGPKANLNKWNHLAAVVNGTDVKLYLNGYEWSGTLPFTSNFQTGQLNIGMTDTPGRYFNGRIDEVRIWNTARTKQEIFDNAHIQLLGTESDLAAYYNMEGEIGMSVLSDKTGNGNNLQLTNMDSNSDWVSGLGECSMEMTTTATVNVSSITTQTITADDVNLCTPGSTNINISSTETGISYYLKEVGQNPIIDGPILGTGGQESLNTNLISSTSSYEVIASKITEKFALSFDGIDDLINNTEKTSFTNNFTYEMWVNPNATHDIDPQSGTGTAGSLGQQRYVVWPDNGYEYITGLPSGVGLGISVGTNGVSIYEHKTNHLPAVLVHAVTINDWTHVAVVCENGSTRLYLNGILVKTGVITTQSYVYPSIYLGGGAYGYFSGLLGDFRLWNYARTETEISDNMYNRCYSGNESNLALLYKLTEGSGTSVSDASFGQFNGTMANMDPINSWVYVDSDFDCKSCELNMANSVTVTVGDTEYPVPDVSNLPNVTGECSVTVSTTPTATDNCSGSVTGTTTDPLTYISQGTYTITWTFDDGNGNINTQEQTVIVDDVTAPIADAANLADVTGECSVTVSTTPTATDNCEGSITGTTSDPLTYSSQGTYTITWTFDDGNGNTLNQQQTVIIDDITAPTADFANLADISGECSLTVSTTPTATDNCEGSITGTTSDPLTYSSQGSYTITWTFDDGNGNTSDQQQTVIVDDITAPIADIANLPDLTDECNVTVSTTPTATDNCEGSITGTTSDPVTYTSQGTFTITWTYDDGNGNSSTQDQTIVIDDITDPVPDIASLPNVEDECSVTLTAPTATDNCEGTITSTTSDPTSYSEQGTYIITWTYDDGNGNTSTQDQTVVIDDITDPVPDIANLPNVEDECSVTLTAPIATDNCEGTITAATSDPTFFSEQGTFTVTWTYDDGNGNTSEQTQTVIVDDVTDPTITCIENQIIYLEEGQTNYTVQGNEFDPVPADDNCNVASVINDYNSSSTLNGELLSIGTTTIVWTVGDDAGNNAECSFDVTVNDFVNVEILDQKGISIYPNPTTGLFYVKLIYKNIQLIRVTDITGNLLIETNMVGINNEMLHTLDLSVSANGIYIISIQTEKEVFTSKIVKQ